MIVRQQWLRGRDQLFEISHRCLAGCYSLYVTTPAPLYHGGNHGNHADDQQPAAAAACMMQ
jgi:hypothetical protein